MDSKQESSLADSQAILLSELRKANLNGLVLPQEGEDVFECSHGQSTTTEAPAKTRRGPAMLLAAEPILEITRDQALKIHNGSSNKQHPPPDLLAATKDGDSSSFGSDSTGRSSRRKYYDIESEETTEEKIEKIMNRIVVRRQRAYLTGLLTERTRARTTSLIHLYEDNMRA